MTWFSWILCQLTFKIVILNKLKSFTQQYKTQRTLSKSFTIVVYQDMYF